MIKNLVVFFAVALNIASAEGTEETYPEFAQLIEPYGYTWEAHKAQTRDAYILTMFRITGKNGAESKDEERKPVLLAHGLHMDSTSWFKSPGHAGDFTPLPLALYDAGFDVWLSNSRGTKYSQGHAALRGMENDRDFWYWSYAEFAKLDVPAELKKIKEETSVDKVAYIGYHLTSTSMFLQLSTGEDQLADLMERFVSIDPCLIHRSESTYLDYLLNEARM